MGARVNGRRERERVGGGRGAGGWRDGIEGRVGERKRRGGGGGSLPNKKHKSQSQTFSNHTSLEQVKLNEAGRSSLAH